MMPSPNQPASNQADGVVRFILDGEVHTVRHVDPNTTVLDYLRERLRRTGTKEGCAEGDCGACTVVVGELDGERIRLRAINSCIQFVPTLDGKELFTVESLRGDDGELHPVQQAMVDDHGSQCGFCTPGFVMSLFAMYKSEAEPSRQRINDVLAGNPADQLVGQFDKVLAELDLAAEVIMGQGEPLFRRKRRCLGQRRTRIRIAAARTGQSSKPPPE